MSAKLCVVEQWASPMFGRATITLGIGPHSSYLSFYFTCYMLGKHRLYTLVMHCKWLEIFTVQLHWPPDSLHNCLPSPRQWPSVAKGRRLLVTRMTTTWKPILFSICAGSCELALGSLATHQLVSAHYIIMTRRQPFSRCGYQWDGCRSYISTPAVVMISVS